MYSYFNIIQKGLSFCFEIGNFKTKLLLKIFNVWEAAFIQLLIGYIVYKERKRFYQENQQKLHKFQNILATNSFQFNISCQLVDFYINSVESPWWKLSSK